MTIPPDVVLRNAVMRILNGVHTSMPGIIVSFDPLQNRAVVQPALNKKYVTGPMALPIVNNVPVIFPPNVVFPIIPGDYCLLVFSERANDLWLANGGQVTPDDPRKFDLSDAVAIPGLKPFNASFPSNDNTSYQISFEGSSITIKANGDIVINTGSKVAIGNTTTELLDIVSQLMGLLQGAVVMGPAFNGPLNAAFTAQVALIQAEIDLLKGTIP